MITLLIIVVFLIFPIYVKFGFVFNKKIKKLFYTINLYNFLKINSGYAEIKSKKLFVHVSDKKAIILKIKKNNMKILKDYHVKNIYSAFDLGSDDLLIPLSIGYTINFINSFIRNYLICKNPYIRHENFINIYQNNKFNFYISFGIYFNMLMVLISLIKTLMEKLNNVFKK